jgi:hypothetical protein
MKIQTKTTEKIMNAFLSGRPLKRKHLETNGLSIMLDNQKLVFKCSHSKGTNIKVNFINDCDLDTFNTILGFINSQWLITTQDNKKVLIGQSGVMSNPVDDSTVGFMQFNRSGQQFYNRGIL